MFMASSTVNSVHPPSQKLMSLFVRYHWPGNIRELENMVKRLVVLGDEVAVIGEVSPRAETRKIVQSRNREARNPHPPIVSLKEVSRRAEKQGEGEAIVKVLELTTWNRKRSAKLLNVGYKALLYKIKQLNLTGPEGPERETGEREEGCRYGFFRDYVRFLYGIGCDSGMGFP